MDDMSADMGFVSGETTQACVFGAWGIGKAETVLVIRALVCDIQESGSYLEDRDTGERQAGRCCDHWKQGKSLI